MNEMSQVHVAKPTDHLISVSSSPWALLLKLGSFVPSKTADLINQGKRCSKLVPTLVYFPKRLSFKIYERKLILDTVQFNQF